MKLADAEVMMMKRAGYRVHFEWRESGMLRSDYIPDYEEAPFATEDGAWAFAGQWAKAMGPSKIANVYLVHAHDSTPVQGYEERKLL